MHKMTVGVLRGGAGSGYESSLSAGGVVLRSIPEQFRAKDIFVDRNGIWHIEGFQREPHEALKHVDVVWNALGNFDGNSENENSGSIVQKLLHTFHIPFVGQHAMGSAISNMRHALKQIFDDNDIQTPSAYIIEAGDDISAIIKYLFQNVPLPLIVKGASAYSRNADTFVTRYIDLPQAIDRAFQFGNTVILEEVVRGKRASCGVVEGMRGKDIYALLPSEITNAGEEHCPGNFTEDERTKLEQLAEKVHKLLNLRHYSQTNMVVSPRQGVFVVDVNSSPALTGLTNSTNQTSLESSLGAVGISLPEFLTHVIGLALVSK